MNAIQKQGRRPGRKPKLTSKFTPDVFLALVEDMQSERVPLNRITMSDEVATGLQVIIRKTGQISYHVQYTYKDVRPVLKIGDHPQMTVPRARNLAKTIVELARNGIDVQQGLHERLIRELEEQGTNWRLNAPAKPSRSK